MCVKLNRKDKSEINREWNDGYAVRLPHGNWCWYWRSTTAIVVEMNVEVLRLITWTKKKKWIDIRQSPFVYSVIVCCPNRFYYYSSTRSRTKKWKRPILAIWLRIKEPQRIAPKEKTLQLTVLKMNFVPVHRLSLAENQSVRIRDKWQ